MVRRVRPTLQPERLGAVGSKFLEKGCEKKLRIVAIGAVCEIGERGVSARTAAQEEEFYEKNRLQQLIEDVKPRGRRDFYTVTSNRMHPKRRVAKRKSERLHFCLQEFADLSNGERIVLRDDRGWTGWSQGHPRSRWKLITGQELTKRVLTVLEPDDYDECMVWICERLNEFGIPTDQATIRAVPFLVQFGPRIQLELRERRSGS